MVDEHAGDGRDCADGIDHSNEFLLREVRDATYGVFCFVAGWDVADHLGESRARFGVGVPVEMAFVGAHGEGDGEEHEEGGLPDLRAGDGFPHSRHGAGHPLQNLQPSHSKFRSSPVEM